MKILHTADLHFSNNLLKLEEVVRVSDFIVEEAKAKHIEVKA